MKENETIFIEIVTILEQNRDWQQTLYSNTLATY